MAGPKQAGLVCFGMGFVPIVGVWLSSAAVTLVILHLGLNQALRILPWAVLPTFAWLAMGDSSHLMLLVSVVAGAVVLEASRSLNWALLTVVAVSVVAFVLMQVMTPSSLEPLNKVMMEALRASPEFNASPEMERLVALFTHMAFAWGGGMTACLILLLGRWWQSLLYKPGAFQQEFHALRLSVNQALILCGAMMLSVQLFNSLDFDNSLLDQGKMGLVIAPLFIIPLMLSGIALVHGLVAIMGASVHWLGMFYMSMLFMGHLLFLPLMTTALLDTVMDFRARVKKSRSQL